MDKVDLSNAYILIWVCPKYILLLNVVSPPQPSNPELLISFHLSLLMVYAESSQLFYTSIKTVTNIVNSSWAAEPTA